MRKRGLKSQLSLLILSLAALTLSLLSPVSLTQASAKPALVTCVNLVTEKERVSRTGECRPGREAQANWHKNLSDSAIVAGANLKVITTCSDSDRSSTTYQIIRKRCARNQTITNFSRSGTLPATPVIAEAAGYSHDSAFLSLAKDPAESLDTPIAFYTITATRVSAAADFRTETQRVYFWRDLRLAISGLLSSTTYTLTVAATTVDGTSEVSLSSIPITTSAYVPPKTSSTSTSLAAPAFTLSKTAETRTAHTSQADFGYSIIDGGGGAIDGFSITPTLPSGLSFSSATGLISGTPTETKTATTYTITGTNAAGSSSATYRLRITGDIGDAGPGGGRIFYYAAGGFACGVTRSFTCKYLEVAPNGWNGGADTAVTWAQAGLQTGPSNYLTLSNSIGYGAQNTKAIIDQGNTNTASSAAALARSYNVTVAGVNFSDWFLPAEDELVSLYNQRVAVAIQFSGGAGIHYWSSTSTGNDNGRYVHVAQAPFGAPSGNPKSTAYYVRPIRAF
jgi:hypothetical protein